MLEDFKKIIFEVSDEEVNVGCSIFVQHKLKSCPIPGKHWYYAVVYKVRFKDSLNFKFDN